jgi:hypothetical protein
MQVCIFLAAMAVITNVTFATQPKLVKITNVDSVDTLNINTATGSDIYLNNISVAATFATLETNTTRIETFVSAASSQLQTHISTLAKNTADYNDLLSGPSARSSVVAQLLSTLEARQVALPQWYDWPCILWSALSRFPASSLLTHHHFLI